MPRNTSESIRQVHSHAATEPRPSSARPRTPGKRVMTERGWSSHASAGVPVQRRPAVPARAGGAMSADLMAQWLDTAMRPDLHPAPVQRRSEGAEASELHHAPDGGGAPMPAGVQAKMESAFGMDVAGVRIHEGMQAPAMGALAGQAVQCVKGAYDFKGAKRLEDFTNENRTIYKVDPGDGSEPVVVKFGAQGESQREVLYADVARGMGLSSPDTRFLTSDEVDALATCNIKIQGHKGTRAGAIVMDFLAGDTLTLNRESGEALDDPAFLQEIGRTLAFQVFMKGVDRWPLPIDAGVKAEEGNPSNIMLDPEARKVHLMDATVGNMADKTYVSEMTKYVIQLTKSKDGGELTGLIREYLGRDITAKKDIGTEGQTHVKLGFEDFMRRMRDIDLEEMVPQIAKSKGLDLSKLEGELTLLASMKQVYEEYAPKAPKQKKKDKCIIF